MWSLQSARNVTCWYLLYLLRKRQVASYTPSTTYFNYLQLLRSTSRARKALFASVAFRQRCHRISGLGWTLPLPPRFRRWRDTKSMISSWSSCSLNFCMFRHNWIFWHSTPYHSPNVATWPSQATTAYDSAIPPWCGSSTGRALRLISCQAQGISSRLCSAQKLPNSPKLVWKRPHLWNYVSVYACTDITRYTYVYLRVHTYHTIPYQTIPYHTIT